MALGGASFKIQPGGGQQRASASTVSKSVVQLGVSPKGTPNVVQRIGTLSAIDDTLDVGALAQAVAFRHRDGLTSYAVVLKPSQAGALGSVTQQGSGSGTVTPSKVPHKLVEILISTAGALATMAFRWRVGGTGAFSDPVVSTAGPYTFRVPGTYCTLTFGAGTYVLNSTYTVGLDGVVTVGGGGISTVTQASDPIDDFKVVCTVVKAGALGTAVLRVSLDGGKSTLPDFLIPSNGKVVLPNAGILLTCANTFVIDEVYTFLAAGPGYSSQDLADALTALRADVNVAASLIHVIGLPASAASAISQGAAVEAVMLSVFANEGLDWQAIVECPVVGDIIVSGGAAILDTADTDTVIKTAREGQSWLRTSLFAGTHRQASERDGTKLKRPAGWFVVDRYVDTEPKEDVSARDPAPLRVYEIGRDEAATPALEEAQINALQTERGMGVYLAISKGGFGWKNLTTQADYQDAGGVRALNAALYKLRPEAKRLLGQRPATKADGTIAEPPREKYSAQLDSVIKRAVGIAPGGDFTTAQVSSASAKVLPTSQLGQSPRRIDVEYGLQPLGFVSEVAGTVRFSGVLSVEA